MDRLDDLLAMEQPELHAWFQPPQPELTDLDRYTDLVARTPTIIVELCRKGVTRFPNLLMTQTYLLNSSIHICTCSGGYGVPNENSSGQNFTILTVS
ncbi:MAG: hypothetical protein HQ472_10455 [Ignavibacteria bacterium]|nr:hypothetical protein [Ignavibacteria bacterium]